MDYQRFLEIIRSEGIGLAVYFQRRLEFKLEKHMLHESMFNAGSMFESRLLVEDFLPVLSVIAFGYIVSCLAFLFLN